jgi:hypothetical protein
MTQILTKRRARFLLGAVLPAILLTAGCSGKHGTTVQNDEGEPSAKAPLVSSFKMSDPSAKAQIGKGIYPLEAGSWRWTAGNFSAVLKTPPGAAQKGATLTLALTVSDAVMKQVHSQTLAAAIGATALKSEKYVDAGGHTFTADVPAALLTGDTVTVDFSLDNSLPPGPTDSRELGVIVSAIGIESN